MRRALFLFVILLLFQSAMSCVSTDLTDEQKAVLPAFERVYDSYKTDFILDDAQTYTVMKGDTLPAVVRRVYGAGNGYFFPLIALASGDVIPDAGVLEPGTKLTIPNLDKNLNDPGARQSLKSLLYDIADVYEKKEAAETREYKKQLAADLKIRLRNQADVL
jgi:hypothetical protein